MEQYLKITAGLLLFVQAFHLASFQDTTNSPGRTINPSWLRDLAKNSAESQNEDEQTDYYQTLDTTAMESSNDYSSGITSGFTSDERAANAAPEDAALPHTFLNSSTEQPETTVSSASTTADLTNSSKINMTDAEDKSHNSTINELSEHTTSSPDFYNHTQLQSTTLAPDSNTTQESTANPEEDRGLTNSTGFSNTTTANPEEDRGLTNSTGFSNTTTANTTPVINETSTTSSSTTPFPSVTSETSPATTTSTAADTTEKVNGTNKDFPFGNGSDRDLQSDLHQHKRQVAWGVVLGTAVAVACVGLVAYIILKNRHNKGFSHRKLVEDHPSDPVHRLDNNEPLDLNFGGLAYYNPGLQGDNIQMTHFPGRR